ncbi:MAG TPA: hypothetical protein VMN36_00510 [Verrucomicrobiales bacterium]|nr:hypothetical protein [Verrucomicrobiales bacterium]
MKAHEIFQGLSQERVTEILAFLRENERDIYRTALASLAIQQRLRPVFIQKKPAAQQAAWMHKTLRLRASESMGEHLLQVWLLKGRREMLVGFLDGMGIAHDGEGAVDDLPESLDGEKLRAEVDRMLERHPAPEVTTYLEVFQLQRASGWPELTALLEEDRRLQLAENGAGGEPAAEEEAAVDEGGAEASIADTSPEESPEDSGNPLEEDGAAVAGDEGDPVVEEEKPLPVIAEATPSSEEK